MPLPVAGGITRTKAKLDRPQANDEIALVRRIQQGDELAFNEVVQRFQAKVHSIIFGILESGNNLDQLVEWE